MMQSYSILLAVVIALAIPSALAAQVDVRTPDPVVIPSGVLRVQIDGVNTSIPGLFDAEAQRTDIASPYGGVLDASRVHALAGLAEAYDALVGGGPAAGAERFHLGDLQIRGRGDRREMPVALEVGLPWGISIGGRGGLVRRETIHHHLRAVDGVLGANPDPVGNSALLGRIGAEHEALGAAPYLPLTGTPEGAALQDRVRAATGEELSLPEAPLSEGGLYGVFLQDPFSFRDPRTAREQYSPLNPELYARWQLPHSHGLAETSGIRWNAAVEGGIRIGLETDPLPHAFADLVPAGRRPGSWMAADAELSAARWVSVAARSEIRFPLQRTVATRTGTETPFLPAGTIRQLRVDPGKVLTLAISPRVRPQPGVTIGGLYALRAAEATRYGGEDEAAVFPPFLHEQNRQDLGFTVTIEGSRAGIPFTQWPIDAGFAWYRAISGETAFDHRTVTAWIRVSLRAWGEAR